MKTLLTDYLFLMWAWCFYLNHHTSLAVCVLIGLIFYMLKERKLFNYPRLVAVFTINFLAIYSLSLLTDISFYFDSFETIVALASLNLALTNELVSYLKTNYLASVLKVITLLSLLLYIVAFVLPNDWYSIFTKPNLYLLISFIFAPQIISLAFRILVKEFNRKYQLV